MGSHMCSWVWTTTVGLPALLTLAWSVSSVKCTVLVLFYSSQSFLAQAEIGYLTRALPTWTITFIESLHHVISVKNQKHVIEGLINDLIFLRIRITISPISENVEVFYLI